MITRATCGTTRPTKAIGPLTATAAPGQQGDRGHAGSAGQADPLAQPAGDVLAHLRGVLSGGALTRGEQQPGGEERAATWQQHVLAAADQGAHDPEPVGVEGGRVDQHEGAGQGRQEAR